ISTLEHLGQEARSEALKEVKRTLTPGGHLVLTVDLFLDLAPFTDRLTNRYGTNVDLCQLVDSSGLTLVAGNTEELLGYPQFAAKQVQARLGEYLLGNYPALAQCLVLRRT
ncbi:MAG: class I SAM-dependent methyltransferase, partial [Acidimicrobiales bacterium]